MREILPVALIETDPRPPVPAPGMALCLSGGGYRAMLFHLGALWRLNSAGYLPRLNRISSVSGGSITAGVLGVRWSALEFDARGIATRFDQQVVAPVRRQAGVTIDVFAVLLGPLTPEGPGSRLAALYGRHLFGLATLQDLPDRPRFVINATNLQSGVLWRFMKPYMRDYRVGEVRAPRVPVAVAIAASSAFPPFLSPLVLRVDPRTYTPESGMDLHREPFLSKVVLTDGGVYDNLGLETAWKRYRTILVSDAGGRMGPDPTPPRDWLRHMLRVGLVVDNQVRNLRKRQVIDAFILGQREGAYWGIRTDIRNYDLPDALPCPGERTMALAAIPTRLARVHPLTQQRLINWGYAVADAALRRHVDPTLPPPPGFPYPDAAV